MPRLQILSKKEQTQYESPPRIKKADRLAVFTLSAELLKIVSSLRSIESQVGFTLQASYFRVTGRFFPTNSFRISDIQHVAKLLDAPTVTIDDQSYSTLKAIRHRQFILSCLGWYPYKGEHREKIKSYARWCAKIQVKPEKIFSRLIQSCWENQIELPGYRTLEELITDALNDFEQEVISTLNKNMRNHEYAFVDQMLKSGTHEEGHKLPAALTLLQQAPHSIKPKQIAKATQHYNNLYDFKEICTPALAQLSLKDPAVRYFAEWLRKAPLGQLAKLTQREKIFLHLGCFIHDELKLRTDILADILLQSLQRFQSKVNSALKNAEGKQRIEREKALRFLSQSQRGSLGVIRNVNSIAKAPRPSDRTKLEQIIEITESFFNDESTASEKYLDELEKKIDREAKDRVTLQIRAEREAKLSNKVRGIVLALRFELTNCDKALADAIRHFQQKAGNINESAPTEFLSRLETETVREQSFDRSLYKALLYQNIANAIRDGQISLQDSYKYRSLEDLLLPQSQWNLERQELIEAAGLEPFSSAEEVLNALGNELSSSYECVNERITNRTNKNTRKVKGKYTVATPRLPTQGNRFIATLLQDAQIPVFHVLSQVDDLAYFSDELKHFALKGVRKKPSQATKMAAIIASACNIPPARLAKISRGINEHSLLNTINWYLTPENLEAANQAILNATRRLSLPEIYRTKASDNHTGSDGRKVGVSLESLQARYSFKYFGKDKGVSVYSHVTSSQQTFHVDIIDPAKREASYVLDGLVGRVKHKAIHSTDTHGFSEVVFAVTHLMGVYFAPRFKGISKQSLYTLRAAEYPAPEEQPLKPAGVIARKKIFEQWDQVLRFVASITLQHAAPSQLFNRLNSYSRSHPLYQALKEFGRITKSLFILRYYDDVTLRQNVQWVLNISEGSNKFGRAISFDSAGEFSVRSIEQQRVAALSQALIQNSIVYWNYLYVSRFLIGKSPEELAQILASISASSIMSWSHVNLRGEYDFTNNETTVAWFDLEEIEAFSMPNAVL